MEVSGRVRKHSIAPSIVVITAASPVSENGSGIHCNTSTQQRDAIYDSPNAEYELVDSPNKSIAFNNPLYSDTGPVTVSACVYYSRRLCTYTCHLPSFSICLFLYRTKHWCQQQGASMCLLLYDIVSLLLVCVAS